MRINKSLIFLILIVVVLMGCVIYGVYSGVIYKVNLYYLSISLLLYSLTLLCRSKKLQLMAVKLKYNESIPLMAANTLAGAFIPGRVGEVILSTWLKMKYKYDITKILPTLLIDKIIEICLVTIIGLSSFVFFDNNLILKFVDSIRLNNSLLYFATSILLLSILIIVFKIYKEKIRKSKIISNVYNGLLFPLKHPKTGIKLLLLSIFTVLIEFLYMYFIFLSFNVDIPLFRVIIIYTAGMIVGILSMVPGGQGTTEISMIALLTYWGYNPQNIIFPVVCTKLLAYLILLLASLPNLSQIYNLYKEHKTNKLQERKKA